MYKDSWEKGILQNEPDRLDRKRHINTPAFTAPFSDFACSNEESEFSLNGLFTHISKEC